MSCPDRDELMRWLDGELPEGRRSELEAHLGSCAKCRSLIESQKLIEKVWRDSWQDPDDTAFEMMRRGILSRPPWWKRQRTWFAVAAVFSVYFGVRVFFLDGSGTPMARYAEEATPTVTVTGGRPPAEDSSVEEAEEPEMLLEEETVVEQAAMDEDSPSPEPVEEAVFEEEILSPATVTFSAAEAEGTGDELLEVSGLAGLTGGAASSPDDETEEQGYFSTESVSSSAGVGAADASIGYGGGGSVQVSRALEESQDCLNQSESDEIRSVVMDCAASPPAGPSYLVTAVFPDGTSDTLLREEWIDLFAMLDSIWTGEDITLELDASLTEDTLYLRCLIEVTGY